MTMIDWLELYCIDCGTDQRAVRCHQDVQSVLSETYVEDEPACPGVRRNQANQGGGGEGGGERTANDT